MQMTMADRLMAGVLGALGLAMAVGGFRMDRLEFRQIHPASIPGLVPMILGGLMVICAVLLWREASRGADRDPVLADGSWLRLGLTAGTCLVYALILVGWLPFLWSTGIFVFAFAAIFGWPENGDRGARVKAVVGAAILAACTAFGTSILFSEVFLVRLP
ncbi:tripartite tricarboxylate transporter TctB family protein [Palleronia sp. LCG004]|uniref:tripartite tricarboxylate transporter TctB family protein n=1 Tax=Palleronia sp. LCG004 TaxID=3079304 RepID=UPI002942D33F|nr:tripartite tricarboxylate transporter TctB family protein [Palleronia sp. LCG004]WOI57779.1 tripartite tricarboxylate transporter TctB family protein [Palleronia sp. LCG004]